MSWIAWVTGFLAMEFNPSQKNGVCADASDCQLGAAIMQERLTFGFLFKETQ